MGNVANKSSIFDEKRNTNENSMFSESNVHSSASTEIKVMTWNLQGLMTDELKKRTEAVADVINNELPDVIFFQELIWSSYKDLSSLLQGRYLNVIGTEKQRYASYFTGIFYRKSIFKFENHEVIPFPNSVMDRTKLIVKLSFVGAKKMHLALITSHLESLPKYSKERINQLINCFESCVNFDDKYNVIFAGDLNLEENEEVGVIPKNIKDLWIESGSINTTRYTWDSTQNKNQPVDSDQKPQVRYDRMYHRSSSLESLKLLKFELLGKQMVKGTEYFPSDHWAILSSFAVL